MEKLQSFTYNNLRWKYRKFLRDAIVNAQPSYGWGQGTENDINEFQHFGGITDSAETCKRNLCHMVGLAYEDVHSIQTTDEYFVDTAGMAWPDGSYVIIPRQPDNLHNMSDVCYLVAPLRK